MKEPFFSKSPYGLAPGSQQDLKDYTYFDSVTRKYMERRRKNELRREQQEQQRRQQQLQQCTFRPALTSQQYYQTTKRLQPKTNNTLVYASKKDEPYVRLLNWHHRRETEQRSKLIQREVAQIAFRQSLSIEKRKKSPRTTGVQKLNQSLEETFRSEESSEEQFRSINAVPLLQKEEGGHQHQHSYYQTFQSSKKGK